MLISIFTICQIEIIAYSNSKGEKSYVSKSYWLVVKHQVHRLQPESHLYNEDGDGTYFTVWLWQLSA